MLLSCHPSKCVATNSCNNNQANRFSFQATNLASKQIPSFEMVVFKNNEISAAEVV